MYLGFLSAAEAQGMNDKTFLFLTSSYSEQFAQAASFVGQGVYVPAEFLPYTDPSVTGNEDWIAVMDAHGVARTSFAQGGYLAANHFIEVLESMGADAEITVESVTAALKAQTEPIESTMTGTPWIFGDADKHLSNTAGYPVVLKPGTNEWVAAGDSWIFATMTDHGM